MAKDNKLSVRWSKRERDYLISYPSKPDGHLMHGALDRLLDHPVYGNPKPGDKTFREELEARGYDMTTLRIVVKRKPKAALPVEPSRG